MPVEVKIARVNLFTRFPYTLPTAEGALGKRTTGVCNFSTLPSISDLGHNCEFGRFYSIFDPFGFSYRDSKNLL